MPLSRSQRVLLIEEIAIRLSSEEWALIDVTLKQFSLPRSDEWRGTKDAYVLQMIDEAADHTLIDLAQHAGFQFEESPAPRLDLPFWREGMFRLFVSHLATNPTFAAELKRPCLISYFLLYRAQ